MANYSCKKVFLRSKF